MTAISALFDEETRYEEEESRRQKAERQAERVAAREARLAAREHEKEMRRIARETARDMRRAQKRAAEEEKKSRPMTEEELENYRICVCDLIYEYCYKNGFRTGNHLVEKFLEWKLTYSGSARNRYEKVAEFMGEYAHTHPAVTVYVKSLVGDLIPVQYSHIHTYESIQRQLEQIDPIYTRYNTIVSRMTCDDNTVPVENGEFFGVVCIPSSSIKFEIIGEMIELHIPFTSFVNHSTFHITRMEFITYMDYAPDKRIFMLKDREYNLDLTPEERTPEAVSRAFNFKAKTLCGTAVRGNRVVKIYEMTDIVLTQEATDELLGILSFIQTQLF
jgi:hypothetical protein